MIRRYTSIKPSKGTVILQDVRDAVYVRDWGRCVGAAVGMPGLCWGRNEVDHVRASHGVGMKSPTELGNLVLLCSTHHRWKTEHGREARPLLLRYLEGKS